MKIITHYMIIKEEDIDCFEKKIKELISDSSSNWQPYGDLKCVYDQSENKIIYIQAMVGGK